MVYSLIRSVEDGLADQESVRIKSILLQVLLKI